jgi:ERCC4-related helicase
MANDAQKSDVSLYQKEADEATVTYQGRSASTLPALPLSDDLELHPTRRKEFRQLEQLYDDLGPLALSVYSHTLAEELSRNTFEKESSEQFARAIQYLTVITDFCHETCSSDPQGGRTDKLQKLEALLEREMDIRPDAVGLVFVERRVTAMALNNYFQNRRLQNTSLNANEEPREATATEATATANAAMGDQGGDTGCDADGTTETKGAGAFDQFADASDDEEEMDCDPKSCPEIATQIIEDQFMDVDAEAGQFDDAEEDTSVPVVGVPFSKTNVPLDVPSSVTTIPVDVPSPKTSILVEVPRKIPAPTRDRVRSGVLVRKATQLFKILNKGGREPNLAEQEEARKTWLHQEANIRGVLNDLRRGEINLLIATSVVEEGVDVQACSFVLVFDTLKNIKSYIQMKGRARQKHAKFFVFQDSNSAPRSTISLSTAQEMESRVDRFISSRSDTCNTEGHKASFPEIRDQYEGDSLSDELRAIEAGFYKARHGTVSLLSAKSLLNRYSMAQPMDPIVRSSKAALTAHLPLYKACELILSAHLSSTLRLVSLPERYHCDSKKSRENAMALMACVRLHKHGLLSERLLPLSREEIRARIFQLAESESKTDPIHLQNCSRSKDIKAAEVFMYYVHQESEILKQFQQSLGFEGLEVAVVAFAPLCEIEIETYRLGHPELGDVVCTFDRPEKTMCTQSEQEILSKFFAMVMNARWRRRTRDDYFRQRTVDGDRIIPPYCIACTTSTGDLDWDLMQRLLVESNRDRNQRIAVVRDLSDTDFLPGVPRLWSPQYDETAIYIAYGPSGQLCDSPFPFKKEGVATYQDYFQIRHEFQVPADSQLFIAQRLWELPSRPTAHDELKQAYQALSEQDVVDHNRRYQLCKNLVPAKLPKHACLEPPLANATVLLVYTMVPQLLYRMERTLTAKAFITHCRTNLPILGACLAGLPISKVVAILTASSCGEDDSYERLEWLGDAVLKLVQTDALIKSVDHSLWTQNLHEGDLTCARSGKI